MGNIMDLFSPVDVANVKFNIGSIKEICERIKNVQNAVGGRPTLKAKVGSGGVKVFTVTNGNRDIVVESFQGIIIAQHKSYALFKSADGENENVNTPPVCSSVDGITGIIAETGERRDCESCPYNIFGSAEKGGGKACKNMHRLYILVEGCPVPVTLSIPPTSLEMWRNYAIMDIAAAGFEMNEILTEFSLTNEVNKDGQKYSVVNFKMVGKVSPEVKNFCESMGISIEQSPRPAIEADEYNREPTEIIQQDDEDIPEDVASDLGSGLDEIIENEDEPEEIDFDNL